MKDFLRVYSLLVAGSLELMKKTFMSLVSIALLWVFWALMLLVYSRKAWNRRTGRPREPFSFIQLPKPRPPGFNSLTKGKQGVLGHFYSNIAFDSGSVSSVSLPAMSSAPGTSEHGSQFPANRMAPVELHWYPSNSQQEVGCFRSQSVPRPSSSQDCHLLASRNSFLEWPLGSSTWFLLTLHQYTEGEGIVRTGRAERYLAVFKIAIVVYCFISLPFGALNFFVSVCLLESTQEETVSTILNQNWIFSSVSFYHDTIPCLSCNLKKRSVFILFSVKIPAQEVRFEPLG